jgi:hypothetical protein
MVKIIEKTITVDNSPSHMPVTAEDKPVTACQPALNKSRQAMMPLAALMRK